MATDPHLAASRTGHDAEAPTPATCSTREVCPNCQHTEMSPHEQREQCQGCDPAGVVVVGAVDAPAVTAGVVLGQDLALAPDLDPDRHPGLGVGVAVLGAVVQRRGAG